MPKQITLDQTGCWLDGNQGWNNNYRVVYRAQEWGFKIDSEDEMIVEAYRLDGDKPAIFELLLDKLGEDDWKPWKSLSDAYREFNGGDNHSLEREAEKLAEAAQEGVTGQGELCDKATEYLDSLAPDGYAFNWDMGELSLLETHANQCTSCAQRWGA
jgi:hypothetical protein